MKVKSYTGRVLCVARDALGEVNRDMLGWLSAILELVEK